MLFSNLDIFSKIFSSFTLFICILLLFWVPKINKDKCICIFIFAICSICAFISSEVLYAYFWIECANLPIFFLMVKNSKLNVTLQFVIYTLISACIVLAAILCNSTWLLFWGIAIKIPIWPFYYWLPNVHSKSSTTCSILLASVILKFSSLILVRSEIQLILAGSHLPYLLSFGILCAACQMCMHKNIKTIIAYSSIMHMGMYLFVLPKLQDFTFCLLQHSIAISLAFFALDKIKSQYETLNIMKLKLYIKDWILLMIVILNLIGIPFTYGFISEVISMTYITKYSIACAAMIALSLLISSSYLISSLFRIAIIPTNQIQKRNTKQDYIIYTLLLIIFVIGIFPKIFYKYF